MVDSHIVFRLMSIFIGLGLGFFSYRIMVATKGSLKAWKYATVAGFMFFLWSSLMSIFTLYDLQFARLITGILFMPGTVMLSLSVISLCSELKVIQNSWFTVKNVLIANGIFFLVLFGYNLMFVNHSTFLVMLISVIIFEVAFANIATILGTFYLFRSTKRWIWLLFMSVGITLLLGQLSCSYPAGCCTVDGSLMGSATCDGYTLDYEGAIPLPCSSGLVNITYQSYNLLPLSGLMLFVCYLYLWKSLA